MKFFKVNTGLASIKLPLLRIVISALLLLLGYNRKYIIPAENKVLTQIGTIVTLGIVLVCLYMIFVSVTEIIEMKKSKKDYHVQTFEKREWTIERFFAFLEESDIIDIVIEHFGEPLKISVKSDYARTKPFYLEREFFDKAYYIEETEYTNFDDFKKRFKEIIQNDIVVLVYVGIEDTPLDGLS